MACAMESTMRVSCAARKAAELFSPAERLRQESVRIALALFRGEIAGFLLGEPSAALFERPIEPVVLAEGAVVDIQVKEEKIDVRALVPPGTDDSLVGLYEILARRFDSGYHDTAQRHNEYQP